MARAISVYLHRRFSDVQQNLCIIATPSSHSLKTESPRSRRLRYATKTTEHVQYLRYQYLANTSQRQLFRFTRGPVEGSRHLLWEVCRLLLHSEGKRNGASTVYRKGLWTLSIEFPAVRSPDEGLECCKWRTRARLK